LGTIRAAAPFCGRTSVHVPKRLTLGLGPPSGVSIGRLSGVGNRVGALWDCVSRVCSGGGGCAGGGAPLGAGPCCPDVGRCLSGVSIIIIIDATCYCYCLLRALRSTRLYRAAAAATSFS